MLAGSGAPRRVRLGGARRMPVSGTLFALDEGLIGMVLDAGAHEALAAARRRAVGAAAGRDAGRRRAPSPRRSSRPSPRRRGGCCTRARRRRSATRAGHAVDRRALGGRDDLGGFEVGTSVPLADSDGLTAIVARTGAPARIEDYSDVRGRAAELMRERGYRSAVAAPVVAGGRTWGLVLVASAGALGADAEHRLAGFAELVALALESAEARAELNARRGADPRGGRDRAPAARAQPARRRAAAAGRARRAAAGAGEAARRAATRRWRCCAAPREELDARAGRAARARARPASRGARRPRPRARRWRRSRRARRCRCRVEGVPERAARRAARGRRLLRRRREPDQRGQARRGERAARAHARRRTASCASRSPTTAAAAPTRGKGDGTGLRGLADRVEALGGRLALESPPGAGHRRPRRVLPLRHRALTSAVA